MKYTMFDKYTAIELHNKFNAAMKKFAEENGLKFEPTSARFGAFEFSKKVKFTIKSQASTATEELNAKFKFQRYANHYGLASSLFGKVVNIAGVEYRVAGVNTRARKKPINLTRVSDNRNFRCSPAFLKSAA